jgi:hypothetical protein
MRSDFLYDGDDLHTDGLHIIWPEFEDHDGTPLDEGAEIPLVGYASMWILFEERRAYHRSRLACGVRGYFMRGPHRLADVEVVELLALQQ